MSSSMSQSCPLPYNHPPFAVDVDLAEPMWRRVRSSMRRLPIFRELPIAKNQNTYAKRQREQEKKQRADKKRTTRDKKKDGTDIPAPLRELPFPVVELNDD